MYEDNEKKLYVILNRNHEVSTLMNAACHLSSGITDCAEGNVFDEYKNASSGLKANLSHYPVVVLQVKNSSQLATATQKANEAGITYNFFTSTMLSHSAEQQISDTLNTELDKLDFIAIALFGDTEALKPITKKFSVYK
ncbi:hypothetical protein XK97_17195 [Obesumbacterium proteus]|uniref:DUF2000 domain-containing protein n=1 Tax=Obesumbacterium proteus TaxID=82983 RepID=UPI0006210BEE|nr:DUF2000 domain-containing protein [Obesumbacterium proteus]KKI43069.1 hypothetical protein XK97_17195 [Obesumbacterium proteus]